MKLKKILLFTFTLILFSALFQIAAAEDNVFYLDPANTTTPRQTADNVTVLNANDDLSTLNSGWYLVRGNVTYTKRLTITGDVYLILEDNCELNATKGIQVEDSNSLTIYACSKGTNTGALTATGISTDASIGSSGGGKCGDITISGGKINVTNIGYGAGIGGGNDGGGNIIILGSVVSVINKGNGIGGNGGNITITDSTVTAISRSSASIGGNGGNITITSSTVNAMNIGDGAGIGGNGGNITITGSTVNAMNIGGGIGIGGNSDDMTLAGSTINAINIGSGVGMGGNGGGITKNGNTLNTMSLSGNLFKKRK